MTPESRKAAPGCVLRLPDSSGSVAAMFVEHTKSRRYQLWQSLPGKDPARGLLQAQEERLAMDVARARSLRHTAVGVGKQLALRRVADSRARLLVRLIGKRRSVRHYTGGGIGLLELSTLLCAARANPASQRGCAPRLRSYPSAGALYPLNLYVAILRSSDKQLETGVYFFDQVRNVLLKVRSSASADAVASCLAQTAVDLARSSAVFYITGELDALYWKYADRSLRYIFLEAGHLAQNIALLAASLSLGACPIGGFVDDEVTEFLQLANGNEIPVYVLVVGRRAKRAD